MLAVPWNICLVFLVLLGVFTGRRCAIVTLRARTVFSTYEQLCTVFVRYSLYVIP
jgi:hypothetical protein